MVYSWIHNNIFLLLQCKTLPIAIVCNAILAQDTQLSTLPLLATQTLEHTVNAIITLLINQPSWQLPHSPKISISIVPVYS